MAAECRRGGVLNDELVGWPGRNCDHIRRLLAQQLARRNPHKYNPLEEEEEEEGVYALMLSYQKKLVSI